MLFAEYNEAEAMALFKKDGVEEGRVEGRESSLFESIQNLMETLGLTAQQAMDALKISPDEQPKYLAKL